MSGEIALDPTDVEILKMLTFNSRTSYSTVASSLDITVNTVKNRIKRILAAKVIDNFLTIPHFAILGFDSSFSVLVRHNGISQEMEDRLADLRRQHGPEPRPDWPLELLMTVTLAEREAGRALTIQCAPINATEAEQKAYRAGLEPMQKRFAGTLDQLAGYLARV